MKYPKPSKVTSRTSSVTNSFVQAIIPYFEPSPAEREATLSFFGLNEPDILCVYCGAIATDWDHLFPLVINKRPSGYFSDSANLVPSCGKCNQSKSGANWKDWMLGHAKNSPSTRQIKNIAGRVKKIEAFIALHHLKPVEFNTLVKEDVLKNYWAKLDEIHQQMREAQALADEIKQTAQQNTKR